MDNERYETKQSIVVKMAAEFRQHQKAGMTPDEHRDIDERDGWLPARLLEASFPMRRLLARQFARSTEISVNSTIIRSAADGLLLAHSAYWLNEDTSSSR
jgi:hypothetical protein